MMATASAGGSGRLILVLLLWLLALPAASDPPWQPARSDFLTLARSGWVFDHWTSRARRDPALPPLRFDSAEVAQGAVCLFGDAPHPLSRQIITTFDALLREIYGRQLAITFAGHDIATCPEHQRVYIRLYSGPPPQQRYNADLRALDREFEIGFPPNWREPVLGPAQAHGFWGRKGAAAHLLVNQPPDGAPTPLQRAYFASILIEELFQVVSYGSDILKIERDTPFVSKLQETPANLRYLPWSSERFMRGLLRSNPAGLCGFDVFMMHALARSGLHDSSSPELLDFIEARFDDLRGLTLATLAQPRFATVLDPGCLRLPD